jgi:signal transduction histidine kinase
MGRMVVALALAAARGPHVSVALVVERKLARLSVVDDGTGRPHRGMKERVEKLGGSVTVTSAPGAGARVVAVVPIGRTPAGEAA